MVKDVKIDDENSKIIIIIDSNTVNDDSEKTNGSTDQAVDIVDG